MEFSSAGTFARAGNPAYPKGMDVAADVGLDLSPHGATPLSAEIVAGADLIYAMEEEHRAAVLQLDQNAPVELLRPNGEGVPDPYGEDRSAYRQIYRLIDEALRQRLEELHSERSPASDPP